MQISRSGTAFIFIWVALCAMIGLWGHFGAGWANFGVYSIIASVLAISLKFYVRAVIAEAIAKARKEVRN